ncbi:hypothetical protein ABES25_09900 [Bacillus gobiensis]|uniref:hypothetical protein n=1 Tax=Bacillus gobiensis TaxID=1441095 RepID=UPI003D19046F
MMFNFKKKKVELTIFFSDDTEIISSYVEDKPKGKYTITLYRDFEPEVRRRGCGVEISSGEVHYIDYYKVNYKINYFSKKLKQIMSYDGSFLIFDEELKESFSINKTLIESEAVRQINVDGMELEEIRWVDDKKPSGGKIDG